MLGSVGALIHLRWWHLELTLAHLLQFKSQIWASDSLIRSLSFVLVNVKRDTPSSRCGLGPFIKKGPSIVAWLDKQIKIW